MRLVAIESPYTGDTPEEVETNLRYLRACMADCLARGEAPYASHALYTQPGVLDDTIPHERAKGIDAGFCWAIYAEARVVYLNRGETVGMLQGVAHAEVIGQPVERRVLHHNWDDPHPLKQSKHPPCREDP